MPEGSFATSPSGFVQGLAKLPVSHSEKGCRTSFGPPLFERLLCSFIPMKVSSGCNRKGVCYCCHLLLAEAELRPLQACMIALESGPSVEAGSAVLKGSIPAPFPLARLTPEYCSVVLLAPLVAVIQCAGDLLCLGTILPWLCHHLGVMPCANFALAGWSRHSPALTSSFLLPSGNAIWHQLVLEQRSSMVVCAHCCIYGCGHVCLLTPRCCLAVLVNAKRIFLGFEVSVMSKEEPGLNKLEELCGPSGLPSCISPGDRVKTSLGSLDTSFYVEQLCHHGSEPVTSMPTCCLQVGMCICQVHLASSFLPLWLLWMGEEVQKRSDESSHMEKKSLSESRAPGSWWACFEQGVLDQVTSRGPFQPQPL